MLLTVIVPSHRSFIELNNIYKSFIFQNYPDKRLIIIENGNAIGTCSKYNIKATAVISSEHSKAIAFNTGLEWLRNNGGGPWVAWDDDDYYGPNYLTEVSLNLKNFDVIGKSSIYVRRNDGRLWLIERNGWPLGHSFAGWSDCCDFKHFRKWGEDDCFLMDMIKNGAKIGNISSNHFIWQRSGDLSKHIWPANDEQMVQILTSYDRENSKIIDYGYLTDYELINNPNYKLKGTEIIIPKFNPLNVPGIPDNFKNLFKNVNVERHTGNNTNKFF